MLLAAPQPLCSPILNKPGTQLLTPNSSSLRGICRPLNWAAHRGELQVVETPQGGKTPNDSPPPPPVNWGFCALAGSWFHSGSLTSNGQPWVR